MLAAARWNSSRARPLWLLIATIAVIAALEVALGPVRLETTRPASDLRRLTVAPPTAYDKALARIDLDVSAAVRRAEERPGEWLIHEASARAHFDRARLTGSFADYRSAQASLGRAFEVADPRAGPHLLQAILAFSLHRLDQSEEMLDRIDAYAVPPPPGDRAEAAALRGDIAFYRGRYAEAFGQYEAADRLVPGAADFRLALYHSQMGDRDKAAASFDLFERRAGDAAPRRRAELALQRGILALDYRNFDEALVHFRRADAIFPGHWLIEEHIAEVLASRGELGAAERLYASVVRRTGHPEYIDALAGIARAGGDPARAERLTEIAAGRWSARLGQLPEAAYGHAIDHCLDALKPRCALMLAQADHDRRPHGESKLKLARAMALNGRTAEASALLREVRASGWRPLQVQEATDALSGHARRTARAR